MRTPGLLLIGCLLAALASGCGGGGGGDAGGVNDPNRVGAGWITISGPATTELTVAVVGGTAFVSPTHWACCTGNASDTGVTITWSNDTSGFSGAADQIPKYGWLFQFFLLGHQDWSASIPLAPGSNIISVTATDPDGNLGRAILTVTRTPDSTPPTVVATSPTHQAQGVPVDAKLSATFSELMDPATIDGTAFVVADSNGNPLPGTVTLSANVATFDPTNVMAGSSTYTARITTAARDLAGNNALASEFVWTFSTGSSTWLATSTNGVPGYLVPFSAVWTGTEMIVLGRTNADILGARYNPGTDTWQPISYTGAPSARSSHSAVWTGMEMIVWGGLQDNPFTWVNTGGRYNPATDSWQPVSTVNAPSPRSGATVIWTGTELIVWGGDDAATSTRVNTGAGYNPLTDTWRPITTTSAPSGRSGHTAVWTGGEMVVWGGIDESITWTNTGGRYNPATDSWQATSISSAPVGRNNHTAVWTGSHMIIWGGTSGAVGNPKLNTGGRYNPVTDSWQATTTVGSPSSRLGHTAVWTGSEMFIWGGVDTSGPPVNTGGRYNPATNQWTVLETSGAPSPRSGHVAFWTGSSMVVWGPTGSTGGRFLP